MISKRLLGAVPETRHYIALAVAAQVAGLLVNIAMIFILAASLQDLLEGTFQAGRVVLAIVVAVVLRVILLQVQSMASFASSEKVKIYYREALFRKAYGFGVGYSRHVQRTELLQIAVEGIEQLDNYYGRFVPQLLYAVMAPIILFICLARLDWVVATLLLAFVPMIPLAIVFVQKLAKRVTTKYWSSYIGLSERFLDNLSGLVTLKIYEADEARNEQMNREAESFRIATMRVLRMQIANITVMDLVAYGGAALGTFAVIYEFSSGKMTLAGAVAYLLLVADFFLPLRQLGSYFHVAMNGLSATDRLFGILDLPESAPGIRRIEKGPLAIKLEDVSFAYEPGRPVIRDLNLYLQPGELVAAVGQSGCGKSTIAALMTGECQGDSGKIFYGDRAEKPHPGDLSRAVVLIDASPWLFADTVRANLLVAAPQATDEMLWKVLEEVQLAAFLRKGEGLDMRIAEGASNLSGGQKQRMCIARALLMDAPVYIFDEATANIDRESEEIILALLQRLKREKAILMITHRLAVTEHADRIYLIEDGTVKESGTLQSLLQDRGSFAELYEKQKELEDFGLDHEVVNEKSVSLIRQKKFTAADVQRISHKTLYPEEEVKLVECS